MYTQQVISTRTYSKRKRVWQGLLACITTRRRIFDEVEKFTRSDGDVWRLRVRDSLSARIDIDFPRLFIFPFFFFFPLPYV